MNRTEFYAMCDEDRVVPLGTHNDFYEADDAAPGGTVWIFDKTALRNHIMACQRALSASLNDEFDLANTLIGLPVGLKLTVTDIEFERVAGGVLMDGEFVSDTDIPSDIDAIYEYERRDTEQCA